MGNWFRKNDAGKFMWPGFGENSRVLEWIFNRTEASGCSMENSRESAIGILPTIDSINVNGLDEFKDPKNLEACFEIDSGFWREEVEAIRKYFDEQVNKDLPKPITRELDMLAQRVGKM